MKNKFIITSFAAGIVIIFAVYIYISTLINETIMFTKVYTVPQESYFKNYGVFDTTETRIGAVIKKSKEITCFSNTNEVPVYLVDTLNEGSKPYLIKNKYMYLCSRPIFFNRVNLIITITDSNYISKQVVFIK